MSQFNHGKTETGYRSGKLDGQVSIYNENNEPHYYNDAIFKGLKLFLT